MRRREHSLYKERYGLSDESLFHDFDEFAASGIACDLVINATMDQYHYETALKILNAGYDMLMEKPIVPEAKQLREIEELAKEKGVNVFVCHVLRYTPYYRKIKEIINAGTIGKIMTMEMNEHVSLPHYLASYVRGKWNSEEKCGSGFILAKSCHDLDLMCWLNNASAPQKVASFGNRSQFIPENAPAGATEFCYQCKNEKKCPYSAIDQYMNKDVMPFLVWDRLNKPLDEITPEEKMEFLKHDIYGKCAYTCGGDIVDRQNATKVEGLAKYVHVEDGYLGYVNVPVNLMTGESIAAGVVKMQYQEGLTFVGFEEGRLLKEMAVNYGEQGLIQMVGNAETANQEVYADGIYANLRFLKTGTADTNSLIEVPDDAADFSNWEEAGVDISPIIQY